jgi:signal transduction histidine kinase
LTISDFNITSDINKIMTKNFSIDARAILTLGRDSIKDHTTAIVELVKNSYDADADIVEVEIISKSKEPHIRIADNGYGMSEDEVDNNWLRIGYSAKRTDKVSKKNRRRTGEKGIGRISADRLGAILELRTKAVSGNTYGLRVDWTKFDVKGKDLVTIPIEEIPNPSINIPKRTDNETPQSGTELIIKTLRQSWTEDDIENLHRELSTLTSPFKGVEDFDINLKTDVVSGYSGSVSSTIYERAEIRLDVDFDGETVFYRVKERDVPDDKAKEGQISWKSLLQRSGPNKDQELRFGPISLTLLLMLQKAEIFKGTEFSLTDLRQFLSNNAGVRIYRDNIRVKPYGDPRLAEGDWLGLGRRKASNPAGAGRATYRLSPNQLVGAVFVGRDKNPNLIDSSSREGLIQGDAFNDLKEFVEGCVRLLESQYHQKFIEEKAQGVRGASPTEEVKYLNEELQYLKKDLRSISAIIPKTSGGTAVERTLDRVEAVRNQIQETQRSLSDLQSQTIVYRGLATIGISATVFSHETQSAIDGVRGAVVTAGRLLKKSTPAIEDALDELESAKKHADHISAWGIFALARIRRDKRTKKQVDIKDLANTVIREIRSSFDAVGIDIQTEIRPVSGRTFAMDVEAVLLNLLTNAYAACQQVKRRRIIKVKIEPRTYQEINGCEIVVSDSGQGVTKEFRERIWEPLFTTKSNGHGRQVGTGLGLTIIQSIVNDLKGSRKVDADPVLKGARFTVWLPLG